MKRLVVVAALAAGPAVAQDHSPHQSYDMFKSMSLTQLATMAPDKLKPETLVKVQTGLTAIK